MIDAPERLDETPAHSTSPEVRRRRLVYVAILVVAALLAHIVIVSAVPYSAWVGLNSFVPRDDVRIIVPEGWGFFTRDPREPRIVPYTLNPQGEWQNANLGPHSQGRWIFGFDRRSRAQGVEIGTLFGDVPEAGWTECGDDAEPLDPPTCLDLAEPISVHNPSESPSLCGTVALVAQEPIPWAWRDAIDTIEMPSRVLLLDVACGS